MTVALYPRTGAVHKTCCKVYDTGVSFCKRYLLVGVEVRHALCFKNVFIFQVINQRKQVVAQIHNQLFIVGSAGVEHGLVHKRKAAVRGNKLFEAFLKAAFADVLEVKHNVARVDVDVVLCHSDFGLVAVAYTLQRARYRLALDVGFP